MTEREEKFVNLLQDWQDNSYEEINTEEDVKVFNTVGSIIGLIMADMLSLSGAHDFINLLKLDNDTKQRVFNVYFSAMSDSIVTQ